MPKLTYEEYEKMALEIKQELLSGIEGYLHLGHTHAELDDGYTPSELRRIADAIEEFDRRLTAIEKTNQPKPGPSETKDDNPPKRT